jgi:hypothetical protein
MKGVGIVLGAVAAAAVALLLPQAAVSRGKAPSECGLPTTQPLWIDYGEGSVKPDTRAVLAHPGVVVASSGTAVPAAFRKAGAATMYFQLHLPDLVGTPTVPADSGTVLGAADALYDRSVASTTCPTPWIALNELLGSDAATPWSASTLAYRANVVALVQELAARGAHPALLVHGDPDVTSDQGVAFWRTVAQSATIVYEAYYDAPKTYALGPLLGNRRMRLGMRSVAASYTAIGVPPSRLGFMLGFHSAIAPGTGGRQGLQPTEAWLRVVKWEAFAAQTVAVEEGIPTIWSWGWATFGPESVDPDKAVAACTWLWARDPSLCDAPTMAGPGFQASRTEASIIVPAGSACILPGARVSTSAVARLTRLTKDRHAALTAEFARSVLDRAVPIDVRDVLAVERLVVAREFHGKPAAYGRALARRGASVEVARGVIADALRRRAIAKRGANVFAWIAARESAAVDQTICLRDELPGVGQPLSVGNARDVGSVPLASFLPFLFRDRTAPAVPAAPAAVRAGQRVTVTWASGREVDLAGYDLVRTVPGVPPQKFDTQPIGTTSFVDVAAPAGATYALRAVDTSGNRSALSPASAGV